MAIYDDEEPKTLRIKTGRPLAERFVEADTQEIEGRPGAPPPGEPSPLNTEELFKGLRAMLPFFLEAEIPAERGRELKLVVSDEPPPFLQSLWEDAKGGARALLDQRSAASLSGVELPFCGLLTSYAPAETKVTLYNQGLDWVLMLLGDDIRAALAPKLSRRPLRELHLSDPTEVERAYKTYLRLLVACVSLLHAVGHAIVHLGALDEAPWQPPRTFDGLPVALHEHLAQSLVSTALGIPEVTAPFPASDLSAAFYRLSLNLTRSSRAWALSRPWDDVSEILLTLRALRAGRFISI